MSIILSALDGDTYKQEQEEWENINKLLKRHGFNSIHLSQSTESRGLPDATVLDKQSSLQIRSTLKSLTEDAVRQQELIHGLIESNKQLKDDLRQQQGRASRQEQRAVDLERIIDNVKSKIRTLEDDFIAKASLHHNQLKELQKDKQANQTRCSQQKQKLHEQQEAIANLQKKLYKLVAEEDQRVSRQNKAFLQFQARAPRAHSTTDKQMLDVIDSYEYQISHLQNELRRYEGYAENVQEEKRDSSKKSLDLDATPNYKALLQSYQDQLRESKTRIEKHRLENINLQNELETRPTSKVLKLYKQQVKRLEKILHQNNINSHRANTRKKEEERKEEPESESTKVDDLNSLQPRLCRRYLQSVCLKLSIQDLEDLESVMALRIQQSEAYSKLQQVLASINSVVSGNKAPQLLYKQSTKRLQNSSTNSNQKTGYEHLIPTIEMWADQLISLKELYMSLQKLGLKLMPTYSVVSHDSNETIRVEDLQLLVDTIIEEEENKNKGCERTSQQTLHSFVLHFQKLFDVTSPNGIFPRLNDVYVKLGEMNNAMRNLCNLLGLDDAAPPSTIVNTVGKLCSVLSDNTTQQVQQLFGALDIDVIICKLEEHDDFFPAFEALTLDLLQILGICIAPRSPMGLYGAVRPRPWSAEINHLDDILPAVKRLKVLAQ